jgi:ribose-phosphate pyrophosphokinase
MQIKAGVASIAENATCTQNLGAEKSAMTTLAMLPPPLERLFDRIDAAEPTDAYLRVLLDIWRAQRLQRFLPTRAALAGAAPDPVAAHSFSFVHSRVPSEDWVLVDAGAAARSILGPIGDGQGLTDMRSRRLAVHLRRLFDFVRETAEPVAASFSERGLPFGDRFEVVVAPLASDGREVDSIFGGIVSGQ